MPLECLQSMIMFKQALILTNFSVNYYQNYSDNAQIYEVNKEIFDFFEDGFSSPWLKFSMVLAHLINWLSNGGRVSIHGVKSLWGDHVVFPRLDTGDTDRWRINKGLSPPVSVPGAQSWKCDVIPQK